MSERLPEVRRSQMQAISLWQPWASLVAVGAKWIETRSWPTPYRGRLAIHATANEKPIRDVWDAQAMLDPAAIHILNTLDQAFGWDDFTYKATAGSLPRGCVVATANLVGCVPFVGEASAPIRSAPSYIATFPEEAGEAEMHRGGHWLIGVNLKSGGTPTRVEDQRPFGDFTPGRWAWLLDDIEPVDPPIPARGRQQLWTWADPRASGSDEATS